MTLFVFIFRKIVMGETAFSTKIPGITLKNVPPVKQPMDTHFLRTLKSIVEVEKNPHFRSETLNVESLELKHPKNVIFVAPPLCNAPPQKGITIFI